MKPLLFSTLFTICAVAAPSVSIAEGRPSTPSTDQNAGTSLVSAGNYLGEWRSDADSGQLRFNLKEGTSGWNAEVSFTFQGEQIPTRVTSVTVNGTKVELVFSWDIQGTPEPSHRRTHGQQASGKLSSRDAVRNHQRHLVRDAGLTRSRSPYSRHQNPSTKLSRDPRRHCLNDRASR
jgi:hypothetical protein